MSSRRGQLLASAALIATLVAVALAFVARGNAASVNICPVAPATPTQSICFSLTALPATVSTGGDGGLLVAKFTNQANSTATHVTVSLASVATASITAVSSSPTGCTALPCALGSVPGHQTVKVYIRYVLSAAGAYSPDATLSFDEANVTSPTADTLHAYASVTGSSTLDITGGCLGSAASLNASTASQFVTVFNATPTGGLPCLPVDAAIGAVPTGLTENLVSLTVPAAAQGFVTAQLDFALLPKGSNYRSFDLFEITTGGNLLVLPCVGDLPQTADTSKSTDSCVFSRAKYLTKGASLTLHIVGLGVDPGYAG
jgi:hypothetical protein